MRLYHRYLAPLPAAVAALFLLISGESLPAVQVRLPQGEQALISIQRWQRCTDSALCWVQKDGGDDRM